MYDKYREDLLIWRATSRMAKRNFSDITLGLEIAEVARDLPPVERDVTPPPDTPGGQGPDPLLASVIAPGDALTPEVLPVPEEPEPQAAPEPAAEEADLSEYPADGPVVATGTVGVCGNPDPETDGVQCMFPPNHGGRCDWDVDVENEEQLPLG
jgi:hypothetical protein